MRTHGDSTLPQMLTPVDLTLHPTLPRDHNEILIENYFENDSNLNVFSVVFVIE
jgi:hypothetical protein